MDKGEGVRHEPEEDWWKVGNRFGVLALESDTASDSESFTSDTASTPTPANQSSPTPPPAEPSLAKDSLGEDSTLHEDSEDSALHSGEEEQADPRLWICPNCDSPVEDLPAARKQHIKDTHTLAKPQPPTTSPTKHIQEEIEGPRCSISGKIKAECSLRDHHAGHTMLLEDMVKLAKQRSYVWEQNRQNWKPRKKQSRRNPRYTKQCLQLKKRLRKLVDPRTKKQLPILKMKR